MTKESRWRRILWLEHVVWVLGTWTVLLVALAIIAIGSGLANPLIRRVLIHRIEALTGAQVEIRTVSVGWFSLHATVHGLMVHGKEPSDTEPLFSVEQARIGLRIDSFWGRRVALDELVLDQPRLHIRVAKDGRSNLPTLKTSTKSQEPAAQRLIELHVRRLAIHDGWMLYNNVKSLVALEGSNLGLRVDRSGPPQQSLYVGTLNWDQMEYARRRDVPVPANLSAKFSLGREGLAIEQAVFDIGRSHIDLQAQTQDLVQPHWTYKYRAWLDLLDIAEIYRTPEVPLGRVDARGDGTLEQGAIVGKGSFAADNLTLKFVDFHSANLTCRSSYILDPHGVILPDFSVYALSGSVKGRVTMAFEGLRFRADTHLQNLRLSAITPAIDHKGFPIDKLHWDTVVSGDTVETWHEGFRDFDITAKMLWEQPDDVAAGHIPVSGEWRIRYRDNINTLDITQGEFETPTSRGTFTGRLAPKHTALDSRLDIGSLLVWNDFIHAISGDKPGTPEAAVRIDGSLQWAGKITGPSDGPEFQGHFRGERLRYDTTQLDAIEGDLTYSPDKLELNHARAVRGAMRADIDGQLQLTDWTFGPDNNWSAELNLEKVPLDALQQIGNINYPIQGQLTGQFHGRGTRREPMLTGLLDIADAEAYTVPFNRLRGQLTVTPEAVRLSNAELRFFAPGTEKTGGAGIVTGNVDYRFADNSLTTDLVGASLPLANFRRIRATNLPLSGQVSFRLKSNGPLLHPQAEGNLRVVNFQFGNEVIGSFGGDLNSDGKSAQFQLSSAMSEGAIVGAISLGLDAPFPMDGKVSIKNLNLDPYLMTALHVSHFSGHATADGDINVKGELQQPETIVVDANLDRFMVAFSDLRLENSGPIHITSSRDSLKIVSAALKGTDTNAELTGSVNFTGRRALDMKMNGSVNLALLSGYVPDVDIAGHADINATFSGTLDRPRIVGRVNLNKVSARSPNFPTGLSNLNGDLVFDANRLFFENVNGEAGGGILSLSGSVNYADRPLRYDISAKTDRLRIRYPEGMSWLAGGNLRLSGTPDGGSLSGRIQIQRVTLTEGLESAGALVSTSSGASPTTTSSFLRNLQLDVETSSSPDARMEWPGAHLEADANLRVRGTAENPILLGHIHVISGELMFHGSKYHVARGDLNFANPFRVDPVINVEATTTIQQYEITLNFSGQSSKMNLSYRSDPPLPANDILTLLASGQPSSESTLRTGGIGQSPNAGSALLTEAISSQLGGRVERLFGITRFRVDPGLTTVGTSSSGQNAAARVTVEQQVTPQLTVTYVSNVSSAQQQVIQIEYNVTRAISVVALRDQNGTFGIDVKFRKRLQ